MTHMKDRILYLTIAIKWDLMKNTICQATETIFLLKKNQICFLKTLYFLRKLLISIDLIIDCVG